MTCPHCQRETPALAFCTYCGADLVGAAPASARRRLNRFAAHPHERVLVPAVFSTLLPHLRHHQLHQFRAAGLAGLAVVVLLTVLGFIGLALIACAILVPFLFLLYLRETEVYRREPAAVLARSLGAGVVVGLVVTALANYFIAPGEGEALDVGSALGLGVLVPLVAEALKPLAVLPLRRRFAQTVDGLTFGVAAGLGYALSETALNFSSVIGAAGTRLPVDRWLLTVISAGVLVPLMEAGCSAAVVAAWWRLQGSAHRGTAIATIAVAGLAHVSFSLGSEALLALGAPTWTVPIWQAAIVAALLVHVRVVLHDALLHEAEGMGLRLIHCSHCGRTVEAAGFCPECGAAVAASSRRQRAATSL